MAHKASQAYIELTNWAFKDESALSGENSEKFQMLEEVGLYVDRIAKQQQRSNTSYKQSHNIRIEDTLNKIAWNNFSSFIRQVSYIDFFPIYKNIQVYIIKNYY